MNRIVALGISALLAYQSAAASDISAKDWAWNIDSADMVYALTTNSAGHMLGQYCYSSDGNCLYLVGFDTLCDKGAEYPALVNTDKGARSITFICGEKIGTQSVMVVSDFDAIDKLVTEADRIGFVIPMKGDEFKAVRFSLRGAQEAVGLMRAAALRLQERKGNSSPESKPAAEKL